MCLSRRFGALFWSLGKDKVSGSDGFSLLFFHRYWPIIQDKVVEVVQMIFDFRDIPAKWRKTMITLIPKRPSASTPAHFRPISLAPLSIKYVLGFWSGG